MTEKNVIEIRTPDGKTISYPLAALKPCPKCGATPEIFCDKDTLTAVVYCDNCKDGAGFSVLGEAINIWNYRYQIKV